MFFPRIDDSHCNRIHSSLNAVHCFGNGEGGKQPVAWKEYCAEYCLKELQESMDSCTGCRDITEIQLKTLLNTIQSINQLVNFVLTLFEVKTMHQVTCYFVCFACTIYVMALKYLAIYHENPIRG